MAKPPDEVFAFRAYMFESLQSFYNALIKAKSVSFLVKPTANMSKVQNLCR